MSLQDEILNMVKSKDEYRCAEQEKRNRENGNYLISYLIASLKSAASKGELKGNKLSGTLVFSRYESEIEYLKPNVEMEKCRIGLWHKGWRITVYPTQDIIGAYRELKAYADKEHITLSDMYIIEGNHRAGTEKRYYKQNLEIKVKKDDGWGSCYYAVDYTMDIK